MPFTVKLQDIVVAASAFENAGKATFPTGVSYKIGKRLRVVATEHKEYNEKRNEVIQRYGEPVKDEHGKIQPGKLRVKPDPESQNAFNAEMNELLDVDVILNTEKMKLADLEKAEPALTPNDFMLLDPFIEE